MRKPLKNSLLTFEETYPLVFNRKDSIMFDTSYKSLQKVIVSIDILILRVGRLTSPKPTPLWRFLINHREK